MKTKVPVVPSEKNRLSQAAPIALAVGYSVRALAQALSDSGFRVIAIDAFGDCDTREISVLTHRLASWGSPGAELSIQPHLWSRDIGEDYLTGEPFSVPVFLGGGCENWPALQQHLANCKQLRVLGPNPKQFLQLRNVHLWKEAANSSGMKFPKTVIDVSESSIEEHSRYESLDLLDKPTHWLSKSVLSAGGVAVKRLSQNFLGRIGSKAYFSKAIDEVLPPNPGRYLQQEVKGRVLGAVCIVKGLVKGSGVKGMKVMGTDLFSSAIGTCRVTDTATTGTAATTGTDSPGDTATGIDLLGAGTALRSQAKGQKFLSQQKSTSHSRFLGATEAWQKEDWDGPTEFIYRGSWGPVRLTAKQQRQICDVALYFAIRTGVTGWLQIDCIEDHSGELWFLEVNPRWSAGMEVLHRARAANPIVEHLRVWTENDSGPEDGWGEDGWGQSTSQGEHSWGQSTTEEKYNDLEPAKNYSQRSDLRRNEQGTPYLRNTQHSENSVERGKNVLYGSPSVVNSALDSRFHAEVTNIQNLDGVEFSSYVGKAVVYCNRDFRIDSASLVKLQSLARSEFADIPSQESAGHVIQSGHPLLTALASMGGGLRPEVARQQLLSRLKQLQIRALQQANEQASTGKAMNILLCYPVEERHLQLYQHCFPNATIINAGQEHVAERLAEADIFVGHAKVPVPWDEVVAGGRLRLILSSAAGLDHCLVPSVIGSDAITVCSASGLFANQVGEQTLALILGLLRGLPTFFAQKLRREFVRRPTGDLHGKRVGIVGLGGNGRRLVQLLGPFQCEIHATDYYPVKKPSEVQELLPADRLLELAAWSDILILCLPLNKSTHRIINRQVIRAMPRGSYLINVARGQVVDEPEMIAALKDGHLAGAGLDVTYIEPLPMESQLWELPNVIITPHVGAQAQSRVDDSTALAIENLQRYFTDRPLLNMVDKHLGFPHPDAMAINQGFRPDLRRFATRGSCGKL